MKEMQEYIDKVAIKELISKHAITFDTGDSEGFANCFNEDAVWEAESLGGQWKGRKELRTICDAVDKLFPGSHHFTYNHVIDVKGDKAHSICELMAFASTPEGIYPIIQGFYEDDLVKVDGKWLISHRQARAENAEIIMQGESGEAVKRLRDYVHKQCE